MKDKHISMYVDLAHRVAKQSYCQRLQVGAVIVTLDDFMCIGYNGMPSGLPNQECEFFNGEELKTSKTVLHAESNAILKAAKGGMKLSGSTLFVTHAPCMDCAKLIVQAGISRVIFSQSYRCASGVELLRRCNVQVDQILPISP